MSKQLALLLDTNVWLDYYLPWRAGSAVARQLIERVIGRNDTLAYAAPAIKDVYYLVAAGHRRIEQAATGSLTEAAARAAATTAWGCVNNMQEIACAVPIDHTDVWVASKQRALHADFEDDLVIAAALRGRVDYLVTNDETLLKHCPVAALSAADIGTLLAAYED